MIRMKIIQFVAENLRFIGRMAVTSIFSNDHVFDFCLF